MAPTRTPTKSPNTVDVTPSRAPSSGSQTPSPTNAMMPSTPSNPISATDCTVSCSFYMNSMYSISTDNLVAVVAVSTYFKIQFEYTNPTIRCYPYMSNILDLVDSSTGESLLSVSLPWTTATSLSYGGAMLEQWGPTLVHNYKTAYTTITVVVQAGVVSITSSSNPAWVKTISIAQNIDTRDRFYRLYLGKVDIGSNRQCADGNIKNVRITGTKTVQTVSMPTTDCTVYCSFLTGGATLAVRTNQTHAVVVLSTYFTLQFDYVNPSIGAYPCISNILDLVDASTGQSLLYVSLPWTTSTVVGYNGDQIEAWGPTLVSDHAVSYTRITVIVQAGKVSITSSSNPGWVDTKYVSMNGNTAGRLFYLYLSNPNVDFNFPAQSETRPSAGGTIKNIVIAGNYHPSAINYFYVLNVIVSF